MWRHLPDDKAMYEYRELSNPVSVFCDGVSSLINEILPDGSMKSSAYNNRTNKISASYSNIC
jgi:hypothetical protein